MQSSRNQDFKTQEEQRVTVLPYGSPVDTGEDMWQRHITGSTPLCHRWSCQVEKKQRPKIWWLVCIIYQKWGCLKCHFVRMTSTYQRAMKKSIGSQRKRKLQFPFMLIDNSKYIYDLLLLKTLTSSYVFLNDLHHLGLPTDLWKCFNIWSIYCHLQVTILNDMMSFHV